MTASTVKSRLAKANRVLTKWRKKLQIDPKWGIDIIYHSERYPDSPDELCTFNDESAQYWKVELVFLPELMEMPTGEFNKYVEYTIIHELLHLIMWQFSSTAANMAGKRNVAELVKLEEQVVTTLEEIIRSELL